MDTSIDFAYPDWGVTLTIDEKTIKEIINKGSLEDSHMDIIFAAIKHIHDHCL